MAKKHRDSRPPLMQRVLDDVFLLFAFGLIVPIGLYIVWGLIELAIVPPFTP